MEVLDEEAEGVIDALLTEDVDEPAKETYVTLRDKFLREGRAKGREEGRAEGERAVLLKQLELKFGRPSAETQQRVQEASLTDLDRWAERILTASRLEDVWG